MIVFDVCCVGEEGGGGVFKLASLTNGSPSTRALARAVCRHRRDQQADHGADDTSYRNKRCTHTPNLKHTQIKTQTLLKVAIKEMRNQSWISEFKN